MAKFSVSPDERIAMLDVANVQYLRCGPQRNTTVAQPAAQEAWTGVIEALDPTWVDSTHCGFVERRARWLQVFDLTLARM